MTEMQEKFLDLLFSEDPKYVKKPRLAAREAGYSDNTTMPEILDPLMQEIKDRVRAKIDLASIRAQSKIEDILDDPAMIGGKLALEASKDILDRGGFKQAEKVEVKAESPLFILPPKQEQEDEEYPEDETED